MAAAVKDATGSDIPNSLNDIRYSEEGPGLEFALKRVGGRHGVSMLF